LRPLVSFCFPNVFYSSKPLFPTAGFSFFQFFNSSNMKHVVSLLLIWCLGLSVSLMANNIAVSNVITTGQNTSAGTNNSANYTMVEFDLSWNNSWRSSSGPSNWDAAWVFVKFMVGTSNPVLTGASSSGTTVTVSSTANLRAGMPVVVSSGTGTFAANTVISSISSATQFVVSATPTVALSNATVTCQRIWEHASLDATANNHTAPAGSSISVPSDSTGAFIYQSSTGTGNVNYQNVQLRWQYGTNGVADDAVIQVQVFAIEMVYVPQGSFAAGSGGQEASVFTLTTINTATATTVPSGSGGFSGSAEGGYPSGQTAPANASWPNGYDAFYCMKYEISQGQYRDFLNTLTYNQQTSRAASVTGAPGTAALNNNNANRNGLDVQTSGVAATLTPAVYGCNLNGNSTYNEAADGEWIACNFLAFMDGCAYMDWAGLRPMTELEYEKACRGNQAPLANEYAWGSTSITQATSISSGGANNETSTGANCVYGPHGSVQGPLRVGAFAGVATTREQAGATYYGIMEMSGNLWERAVTIGNADGRGFTGVHGNGRLSANGHANQTSWPGLSSGQVTGDSGSGFRGGGWDFAASYAQVSDRNSAASTHPFRWPSYGFRGVRVFP
jgi:formylglycine-generating enzyme required for sulfatase activity